MQLPWIHRRRQTREKTKAEADLRQAEEAKRRAELANKGAEARLVEAKRQAEALRNQRARNNFADLFIKAMEGKQQDGHA